MTRRTPEFLECEQDLEALPPPQPRLKAEAIGAGLDYLLSEHRNGHWSADPGAGPDLLVTACVLARLKDVLPFHSSHRLRVKISESLDWLLEAQTPGGGWAGRSGKDEAGPTAWAILALGKNGRVAPESALIWLRRCRRRDGGFGSCPDAHSSSLEITALSAQALGHVDDVVASFLRVRLESEAEAVAEQLAACAAILDCERSPAWLSLVDQACQALARVPADGAANQALLLRCLLRLRLTRAWVLADNLRNTQRAEGSWHGTNENDVVATANVVSALALFDSQPGLYFGSDLPLPRRWRESAQG